MMGLSSNPFIFDSHTVTICNACVRAHDLMISFSLSVYVSFFFSDLQLDCIYIYISVKMLFFSFIHSLCGWYLFCVRMIFAAWMIFGILWLLWMQHIGFIFADSIIKQNELNGTNIRNIYRTKHFLLLLLLYSLIRRWRFFHWHL